MICRQLRAIVTATQHMILGLLLALLGTIAIADPVTVILDPANAPFDLAKHAEYLIEPGSISIDPDDALSLPEQIKLAEDGAFSPITTPFLDTGFESALVYWHVPFENRTDQQQTWMLAFNQPVFYYTVAYLVVDEEILPIKPFIQNYETRDWVDEDLQVHGEFDVPADASGSLYISFANNRPNLLITIENVSSYEVRRHRADTIFNMTIGFIAGLASIVIILMTTLRNWAVLPYAAYILGATSMVTVYEGHFFHSFWRTSEQNEIFIVFLLLTLTMSGLFLFQRAFLRSQNVAPKYRVVLLVATVSAATLNFVMSFTPLAELEYITIFALILLGLLFALSPIAGAIAVAKKQRGGLPFFLGSLVFTSSVLWVLYVGFNSAKYSSQHAPPLLRYAVAFEVVMFSLALLAQVRGMRMDTENALRAEIKADRDKLEMAKAVASTAHDLQQPLTSLRLAMQQTKATGTDVDSAFDYLEDVLRRNLTDPNAAMMQQSLQTDALLSHGSSPMNVEELENFEIDFVLHQARSMFQDEALAKGLDFRVVRTSHIANGSPFVIMRVLANLISNAIKNTDHGKILIGCRRQGDHIRIDVCDTGAGIAADDIDRIQEPYQRTGTYDGAGLGLSIVRQLCDEHGLTFNIRSEPGRGSVASLLIPKAR